MKLPLEQANLISVFIRKLKQDKTYADFREAWFPDRGFGIPVRVINAINQNSEKEILSVGFMKVLPEEINAFMKKISQQESVRHSRIADVIETTKFHGIYRIVNDDDLSSTMV